MSENENTTPTEAVSEKLPKQKISKEQAEKQKKILITLIILLLVGGIFVLYRNGVIGGGSSTRPVETYLNAIAGKDFEAYVSVMPPRIADDYRNEMAELGLDGEGYMRRLYDDYFTEFGENLSVSFEITDRSRPDKENVDNFKQSYLDLYGEEIRISSVFEVDVYAVFSGEKSTDGVELECFVIKSGGKWLMAGCDYKTEEVGDGSEED